MEEEIEEKSYLRGKYADQVLFYGVMIIYAIIHIPLIFPLFKTTLAWMFHHFQTQKNARLSLEFVLFCMAISGFHVYNFLVWEIIYFALFCFNVWFISAWIFVACDQVYIFTKKKLYPNRNHYPRLKSKLTQKILMPPINLARCFDLTSAYIFEEYLNVHGILDFKIENQIIGLPQNFNPLLAPAA